MSQKTIKIKIAIVVTETGSWEASGCGHVDFARIRRDLIQSYDGDASALNVHTLEVEVTLPAPAPDITARKLTYFRRVPHKAD